MSAKYFVIYRIVGTTKAHTTRCYLSPEYHTTFGSIPGMIALKRGVEESEIEILSATLIEGDNEF